MPAIYEKPVRQLMRDMVSNLGLNKGEVLTKERVRNWFKDRYPKIKDGTISAHLIRLSTNASSRVYYTAKPQEDDLFFQLDGSRFRLFDPGNDPPPIYKTSKVLPDAQDETDSMAIRSATEFAYEKDLRSFLSKNLEVIEPGLQLYEDEGINGIEFPAGGRFIDILSVDKKNNYVVIELKVSKGYDRVVGQLLRYMAWIEKNQAEPNQIVRGIIVAREISEDLLLACSGVPGIQLFEYEMSVTLKKASISTQ